MNMSKMSKTSTNPILSMLSVDKLESYFASMDDWMFIPFVGIIIQYAAISLWQPGAAIFLIGGTAINIFHIVSLCRELFLAGKNQFWTHTQDEHNWKNLLVVYTRKYGVYFVLWYISNLVSLIPWAGSPIASVLGVVRIFNYNN